MHFQDASKTESTGVLTISDSMKHHIVSHSGPAQHPYQSSNEGTLPCDLRMGRVIGSHSGTGAEVVGSIMFCLFQSPTATIVLKEGRDLCGRTSPPSAHNVNIWWPEPTEKGRLISTVDHPSPFYLPIGSIVCWLLTDTLWWETGLNFVLLNLGTCSPQHCSPNLHTTTGWCQMQWYDKLLNILIKGKVFLLLQICIIQLTEKAALLKGQTPCPLQAILCVTVMCIDQSSSWHSRYDPADGFTDSLDISRWINFLMQWNFAM